MRKKENKGGITNVRNTENETVRSKIPGYGVVSYSPVCMFIHRGKNDYLLVLSIVSIPSDNLREAMNFETTNTRRMTVRGLSNMLHDSDSGHFTHVGKMTQRPHF